MSDSILLLDDVEIALTVMKLFLKRAGYPDVVTFDHPHNALSYIGNIKIPSLIITDYKMPSMNGIEFLEFAHSISPAIPSIIVTGDAQTVLSKTKQYCVIEKGSPNFFKNVTGTVSAALRKTEKREVVSPISGVRHVAV